MKTIVTGGAGFIGSHLTEFLLEENHEVIVIDNLRSGKLKNLERVLHHPSLSFYEKDIQNKDEIAPLFSNVDCVFHLAALLDMALSLEKPDLYFNVNVLGTLNVLEASRAANVGRFIYTASCSCYGITSILPTPETAPLSPQNPYALTKQLGEQLVMHWEKVFGRPSLSLRLFNVYGPHSSSAVGYDGVIGIFLSQRQQQKPFTIKGEGTQFRDFVYVSDVVEALYAAAQSELSGEIFNVGTSTPTTVKRIAELLQGAAVYLQKTYWDPDQSL